MFGVLRSSSLDVAICATLFLTISVPAAFCAQSCPQHSKAASQSEVAAPKLSPKQEHGLRLLKSAEAKSAGLKPNMHDFVLWRASYVYRKLERKQAEKASREAFMATQAIEAASDRDHCAALGSAGDIKSWIQLHVLSDMVHKNQVQGVEQLLPQATAPVRNKITAELVRYYQSKKDLPHAHAFLSQLADSDNYPFGAAADLITALGAEHSADRMSIFNQALNTFEQHASKTSFGGDDIGSFIERELKDVPPGLVLEAIGKVLEAAKEQALQAHYSMSSAKGSVVLNSDYNLRLFQLLPILEELDKDKAEALLRERTEVAEQLKTYPKGMQSLTSENTDFSCGVTDNGSGIGGAAAKQQIEAQLQERIDDILKKADADPSAAVPS